MKSWLQIGQVSKATGLTNRALRMYEKIGLLEPKTIGNNGYRYYSEEQVKTAISIKRFKGLGFSLNEIKSLLVIDSMMDTLKITSIMQNRLNKVKELQQDLADQEKQLKKIIIALKRKPKELNPLERRYIMGQFNNVSVVVTGTKDLGLTAQMISKNLSPEGPTVEIFHWNEFFKIPDKKPHIIVLPEKNLQEDKVKDIQPDIVVIKNISAYCSEQEKNYLKLFSAAGPHMTTVFNADDKSSVKLAANNIIQKGRIFYFSKRLELVDQIKKNGGVTLTGNEIKIFGFNLTKETLSFLLEKSSSPNGDGPLIASLAAVLDVGLNKNMLKLPKT